MLNCCGDNTRSVSTGQTHPPARLSDMTVHTTLPGLYTTHNSSLPSSWEKARWGSEHLPRQPEPLQSGL